MSQDEQVIQREYYAQTAHRYDEMHVQADDEHYFALSFLVGAMDYLSLHSVLDVGAGTGRTLLHIKKCSPRTLLCGIEPVEALRKVGYEKGLSPTELTDGDGTRIQHPDRSFDVVCAFGVLHHVPRPERVIAEMLRVARKAIFISDSNNFGQGSPTARLIKQSINALGLWPFANWVKTRGKGYSISEGDGLAYSYSLFNNYRQIAAACRTVHVLNTSPGGINPYRSAGHVAILGVKPPPPGVSGGPG